MKYIMFMSLVCFGCATPTAPIQVVKHMQKPSGSWNTKKRECHDFYMNKYGLKPKSAIKLCKEELGQYE